MTTFTILITTLLFTRTSADFDCACNYNVEAKIFPKQNTGSNPIGYLYEFDCKHRLTMTDNSSSFTAIEFEHQLGYVEMTDQIQIQICPGDPSLADTIGPPLSYIGVGYNTAIGFPTTKQNGIDPGLNTQRRIYTLTLDQNDTATAMEVMYNEYPSCNITNTTSFIYDGLSYQRDLLKSLSIEGEGPTSNILRKEAFLLNTEFSRIRNEVENRNNIIRVYADIYYPCIHGELHLINDTGVTITKEFAKDVCQLPSTFDMADYSAFIDKWGTSVVVSTKLGSFSTKRYKTTGDNLLYKLNGTDKMYLTGPYKGFPSSVTFNTSALGDLSGTTIGTPVATWSVSRSTAVPLQLKVDPLSYALDPIHWNKVIIEGLYTDVCPSTTDKTFLDNIKSNIERALAGYNHYKEQTQNIVHKPIIDEPIQIPLAWPYGTYGLMQASNGCPGSQVAWKQGSRGQDTEHFIAGSTVPNNIRNYLAGSFTSTLTVTHFCMKTQASTNGNVGNYWPSGSYCILKYNICPTGFQSGSIFWDDNSALFFHNKNSVSGVLPDGTYDDDTRINYCCRKDGSPTKSIPLPRDKPFVLLRYGRTCQSVFGMETNEVYIRWDDEDIFNKDSVSGAHPADDGDGRNHMLHFCHYKSRQTIDPSLVG